MRDISVVIPAYNEEHRIGSTLDEVIRYLKERRFSFEVIVVADGSLDKTPEIVKSHPAFGKGLSLLENSQNRGKGFSVRRGMLAASKENILFADADNSTPISELEKLLSALEEGFDAAIGSRALPDSFVEVHQAWPRENMGKIFNLLTKILVMNSFCDTQCGFKLFTKAAARKIFSQAFIDGFAFDVEVLVLANKLGLRVKEVGVRWRNSPQTKVSPILDSARMLRDIIRIRRAYL